LYLEINSTIIFEQKSLITFDENKAGTGGALHVLLNSNCSFTDNSVMYDVM